MNVDRIIIICDEIEEKDDDQIITLENKMRELFGDTKEQEIDFSWET